MTVEEELREYGSTLDAATERAAAGARGPVAPVIRLHPARSLIVAAIAVAAAIAIAFAVVGTTNKRSTPPAGVTTIPAPSTTTHATRALGVPNVVGMRANDAREALTAAGLRVMVREVHNDAVAAGLVISQSPAAGASIPPGTTVTLAVSSGPAGAATTTVGVTVCPTEYGVNPTASDPKAPKTLTISTPPFSTPALAGYSDLRGYMPITAPAGWNCKAIEAGDGGQGIGVTPPGATPRDSWGNPGHVTTPLTDGVFAASDAACQGCIYDEVCGIVPSAAADFASFASLPCTRPPGEVVTDRGNGLWEFEDPAGTIGPDAARSLLRYTRATAHTDASVVRESCIVPAAQSSAVCSALFAQFLTLQPTPWTQPALTISPTALGAVRVGQSLFAAQEAAGLTFDGQGDGFAYPQSLMDTGVHLYVGLHNGSVVCIGAEIVIAAHAGAQRITTPDGFALGGTVPQLLAIYPHATYVAAPKSGMSPNAGYVVKESGGALAFVVNPNTHLVDEIAGGNASLTPSTCTG